MREKSTFGWKYHQNGHNVILKIKFDVEITKKTYKIGYNLTSLSSITSRRTCAMMDAINAEIEKLEKAGFIEL